ncbi:MAG TPA: phenylalanine--tRNA ligase subunit alpha [Candidatus Brocadiia bacterium]|nr:phenylalanine--tRNA ligase subunit alpha [Candidatus Brocadiia bacterium]
MDVEQIRRQALEDLSKASTTTELDQVRTKYLGRKKGLLDQVIASVPGLPPEQRRAVGKSANDLKNELTRLLDEAKDKLSQKPPAAPRSDPTLPGPRLRLGHVHPLTQTTRQVEEIFSRMGFEVVLGPETETEFYNFEALNIPADHPSRDSFDTFYLSPGVVLRSHTSPVQVRVMESRRPPLRVLAPGRVYRPDTEDARHASMFHQVEGLMVDERTSFADLKAMLFIFAREFFGSETKIRFRPSFFPFTEPSAEVDVSCFRCKGKGCSLCSGSGWIEVLGSGMVDPAVFEAVGYDPERYTGFAFGMGVERLCMLKYGIDDIRVFTQNDCRVLSQF